MANAPVTTPNGRRRRSDEERLSEELGAMVRLHELIGRLLGSRDLDRALEEVLTATIAITGARKGNVQLFDPAAQALRITAHRGFSDEFVEHFAVVQPGDDTCCSRALETRRRVVIEDVESDDSYASHRAAARAAGYRGVQSTPLLSRTGEVLGVLSTHYAAPYRPSEGELRILNLYARQATDFLERVRSEAEHRQARLALEESDRLKEEFLAVLSHELRNPLAALSNGIALLEDAREPAQVDGARRMMARQVEQLAQLVEDLLDVSRINRGMLSLRRTRTDLASVLAQALDTCPPAAADRTLEVDLPAQPLPLDADPARLTQVFANLLHNACKFTSPGGRIQVRAEPGPREVVVRVTDDGAGIAPEDLGEVFEMFVQRTGSQRQAGTGLGVGLTLVRQLVELHGGRVEARSEGPGRGSEFVVTLPLPAAEPSKHGQASPGPARAVSDLRILVVDDNRDAADSLALLLEGSGNELRTAYDGKEAVTSAAAFRPQVVVLDVGLPDIDGYEVARRIRARPGGAEVLLVALTGWGHDSDLARSREAGFDHHLVKPVDRRTLVEVLAQRR